MGVKSTIHLTRDQAIQKGADLYEKIHRRKIEAMFYGMETAQLEDTLEDMNDEANDGEGFENYKVTS